MSSTAPAGSGRLTCRILPNGEFSVWQERLCTVEPPTEQPDYLGLSILPNSHKQLIGLAGPAPNRTQRGLSGITRLGARTIRNGAFCLEKVKGRKNLSFLTCTLPLAGADEFNAGREWAEIVRIFCQSLRRLLQAAGLAGSLIGCTEIQMKRYRRYGGLPLHLHLVFQGRKPYVGWGISCAQFTALWRRAVIIRCPEFGNFDFSASCNVQMVEKSAAGYLGKYLSKGPGTIAALLADDPELAEFLPRSWWICSSKLRAYIRKASVSGYERAQQVMHWVRTDSPLVLGFHVVEIELEPGRLTPVAVVGRLSEGGRLRVGLRHAESLHLVRDAE